MIKVSRKIRKSNFQLKEDFLLNKGFKGSYISRIRNMNNRRQKLIASAKLQSKVLGDINCNFTAWIAGYSSEMVVRQEFGSHFVLREVIFGKFSIPKKWGNLDFSWEDKIRKLKIPEEITAELAEETGIHIGDGNIFVNKKLGYYRVFFAGNLSNELPYYDYIQSLLKKNYNIDVKTFKYEKKNSCHIRFKSKMIVDFKNKILDLPMGPKTQRLTIPNIIKKDNFLLSRCIRGIFDTDFYLGIYRGRPHFQTQITAPLVIKSIKSYISKEGIDNIKIKNGMLFFGGPENARAFFRIIGSSNPHNISKYRIWEEYGKCPYYSTCSERLDVINGKRDFSELEKIEKERRKKRPRAGF